MLVFFATIGILGYNFRCDEMQVRMLSQVLYNKSNHKERSKILDMLPDGVVICNKKGVTYTNYSAETFLNIKP